jgi:hypothetical protein
MARKTFISYKYSECQNLRDRILEALGDDVSYYKGETSDSPSLDDVTTETIKEKLKKMIHDTSVTIVIVSPNMIDSNWIDWEVEYSLKEIKRGDKTSRTNGVVGVIMEYEGSYEWFKKSKKKDDGCTVFSYMTDKVYPVINDNRYNLNSDSPYSCTTCKCYDMLDGSFISFIEEQQFLKNPTKYIENAFEKSSRVDDFELTKMT